MSFFLFQEGHLLTVWLTLDYICDVIYLADMFVQFRTGMVTVLLQLFFFYCGNA